MRVQVLCTPALLDGSSTRIASLDKKLIREPFAVIAQAPFRRATRERDRRTHGDYRGETPALRPLSTTYDSELRLQVGKKTVKNQ